MIAPLQLQLLHLILRYRSKRKSGYTTRRRIQNNSPVIFPPINLWQPVPFINTCKVLCAATVHQFHYRLAMCYWCSV
jgi:hypothetical protein